MSYFSSSPLTRHELDSILPYENNLFEQKQFLKTKQFYKPQQFIWNNPHRTSHNLYKFYHKYNENYQKNKAPLIRQLELEDMQHQQMMRIKKLTNIRHQTRKRFFTKQKDNQTLQMLSGTRQITSRQHNVTTAGKRFSTITHYHSKPTLNEPMIPAYTTSKIPLKRSNSLMKNIEQTYLTGVEKSEAKIKSIQNIIISETHRHQNKLKMDFQKQKENNSKRISRITKFDKFDNSQHLGLRSFSKQV